MSKRLKDFPVGTKVKIDSDFIVGRNGHVGVVEEQMYYLRVKFTDGQTVPFFPEELSKVTQSDE